MDRDNWRVVFVVGSLTAGQITLTPAAPVTFGVACLLPPKIGSSRTWGPPAAVQPDQARLVVHWPSKM